MKGKASLFLKQMIAVVVAVVKAKSTAVKSKTSAMKTRLVILGLLRNKKIISGAISHKIHALIGQQDKANVNLCNDNDNDNEKAIVLCNAQNEPNYDMVYYYDYDDRYHDLGHSLFEIEDDELGDCTGSVIDLVKNKRKEETEFVLEDEIDRVADVYIRRFHKQMRMQKQDSFKKFKEMMERST